jgi:hypothetical protein
VITLVRFFLCVSELKVFFNHTLDDLLQLHQVGCGSYHYWGRPTSFARSCLFLGTRLRAGRIGVHAACSEGAKKFRVGTVCRTVFTAADAAVAAGFFEVRAASLLLDVCSSELLGNLPPQ